jgi:hypothetical protein
MPRWQRWLKYIPNGLKTFDNPLIIEELILKCNAGRKWSDV